MSVRKATAGDTTTPEAVAPEALCGPIAAVTSDDTPDGHCKATFPCNLLVYFSFKSGLENLAQNFFRTFSHMTKEFRGEEIVPQSGITMTST